MPLPPASDILSPYTVLDLTRARSGPTAARQMADWGANVIKIEAPADAGPGDFSARNSPDFQNLHRNKRSLTLDLKAPEGLEIFNKLAAKADVIIENYRPDVKHRLGIDYEAVKKINPRIVYASISGFGEDGPYAKRPGLDPIIQGMGGHMWVTGKPGEGPMRSGAAISDVTAGLLAANGILMALLGRERTGEGQWVTTSLLEAQIFLLDFQAARWLVEHEIPPQVGNEHPTNVPTGAFRTRDGYVLIAPMGHMWAKFCAVLGAEALVERPEYKTPKDRYKNRGKLIPELETYTEKKDTADWVALMNEVGVPCGPINKLDEVFADPQVRHVGIAEKVLSPARGEIELVGQPLHLSGTERHMVRGAPQAGEHTDEVLREIGLDDAAIERLHETSVV